MCLKRQDFGFELNLLVDSVRAILDPTSAGSLLADSKLDFNQCKPDLLIRLANHHGLVPWLEASPLLKQFATNTPEFDFLNRLHSLAKVQQFNSERQAKIAVEISQSLEQSAVTHVVFKGPALHTQIYPDLIKSRASDDLDLLVSTGSLSKALNILESLNYAAGKGVDAHKVARFVCEHPDWYRGRDIGLGNATGQPHFIDLHWKIADDFSFSANTNSLLESRVMLETRYGTLPTLPLHQHFVYLCTHGYSDYFFRLHYLVDIYLITRHSDFNQEQALKLADINGVRTQVLQATKLCSWLFGANPVKQELSEYGQTIVKRLISHKGFTPRIHPNTGSWTRTDKNQHLLRQIKNRSSKSHWFSPLLARAKITQQQVSAWQPGKLSIFKLYTKTMPNRFRQ